MVFHMSASNFDMSQLSLSICLFLTLSRSPPSLSPTSPILSPVSLAPTRFLLCASRSPRLLSLRSMFRTHTERFT